METLIKNIYYIGIDEEKTEEKSRWNSFHKKEIAVDIHCLDQKLPYFDGFVQIYFSLLPYELAQEIRPKGTGRRQMSEKAKVRRAYKLQRRKEKQAVKLSEVLSAVLSEAKELLEWDELILAPGLCGLIGKREEELPAELFAVFLKKLAVREKINLSLGEESGLLTVEEVILLLKPYLSRINYAVFIGEENEAARELEDFLYEEYGIIMSYSKRPVKNAVWLDFGDKNLPLLEKYAAENNIQHVNRAGILKFLDTSAKNGYNTKVN